ncbi:rRNA pseudouridine synthase [bacterium]|jgi:23S rRNA pseudouridine2605 synthase|nr:rRNA pseudouridine synthase [bacterium]
MNLNKEIPTKNPISLNKFVAMSGLCSRKKAEVLIKAGLITINHAPMTNPAYKILGKDTVRYKKQILKPESKIYILLNKPRGFVTTTADDFDRKTVFDLIDIKKKSELHSIGRLDIDTAGALILTNDGDLTQKLSHPKYKAKKTYHVTLKKPIDQTYLEKMKAGVKLEDGFIKPDRVFIVPKSERKVIGIQIHSGKKHIIKRIFMHIGYFIKKLNRPSFAGISTRTLGIGAWRHLTKREISLLSK